jgi:hypothetical protein
MGSAQRLIEEAEKRERTACPTPRPTRKIPKVSVKLVNRRTTSRRTMAVVLESMQSARETFARSPPGTLAGGSLQTPS